MKQPKASEWTVKFSTKAGKQRTKLPENIDDPFGGPGERTYC